jgi:endonuclease/exonuclease/phosphatase family metal-dependent hydrolase
LSLLLLLLGCGAGAPGGKVADDSGPVEVVDSGGVEAPALVLLSLNLHCFRLDGADYADHDSRFAAIAALVVAEEVGAIALQEACENEAEGVAIARLAAAIEAAGGASWSSAWVETHPAWEGTPDAAIEGVGLLLRSEGPVEAEAFTYAVQGSQLRHSLTAALPAPFEGLRLTTVHLEHDDAAAREGQARQEALRALLPGVEGSLVAGDWNARPADLAALEAAGLRRMSAAADPSGVEIDHVYAPADAPLRVLGARMVFDGGDSPAVSDHPGLLLRLEEAPVSPMGRTHLLAEVDVGFGRFVSVRGEGGPFDWEQGWPAVPTGSARWEAAVLAEGALRYKWLRDDVDWQAGEDLSCEVGATCTAAPVF